MREIKFRAWDGEQMLYMPLTTNFGLHRFFGILDDECIAMQYTGLKDKNGREIYEGDVCNINPDDDNWIDIVVSDKNWLELSRYKNHCVTDCSLYEHHDQVEVIGNIYEHPELLKSFPAVAE